MHSFHDVLSHWTEHRASARRKPHAGWGGYGRTFRRYIQSDEDAGLDGLIDKRLAQASARKAPETNRTVP